MGAFALTLGEHPRLSTFPLEISAVGLCAAPSLVERCDGSGYSAELPEPGLARCYRSNGEKDCASVLYGSRSVPESAAKATAINNVARSSFIIPDSPSRLRECASVWRITKTLYTYARPQA
jgi:hypothetical protein